MEKVILFAAVALASCPSPMPPEPPVVVVDAGLPDGVVDGCPAMCSHLGSDLGCQAGKNENCLDACYKAAGLQNLHIGCLLLAKTKEEARGCGTVECL